MFELSVRADMHSPAFLLFSPSSVCSRCPLRHCRLWLEDTGKFISSSTSPSGGPQAIVGPSGSHTFSLKSRSVVFPASPFSDLPDRPPHPFHSFSPCGGRCFFRCVPPPLPRSPWLSPVYAFGSTDPLPRDTQQSCLVFFPSPLSNISGIPSPLPPLQSGCSCL